MKDRRHKGRRVVFEPQTYHHNIHDEEDDVEDEEEASDRVSAVEIERNCIWCQYVDPWPPKLHMKASRLTVVYNICDASSSHLFPSSVRSSPTGQAPVGAHRHSKPSPSKMLYPLLKMQMINLMVLLLRQLRRHRRRRSIMVLDTIRDSLMRRLSQWGPSGRRCRLLRWEVAMARLLA